MSGFSLYQLCLWKTAKLLKEYYWKIMFNVGNPFSSLPSSVIQDLIFCVIQLSVSGTLKATDLYPLLTSCRVTHFRLDDVALHSVELIDILSNLSAGSQNLSSLVLRNVYCSDGSEAYAKKSALGILLNMSPALETLESCIEFDLAAIRNCEKLKVLKLNFVPRTPLYDFLIDIDGSFLYNYSLKIFEVFEDERNIVDYVEMAIVLKYCCELIEVHNDIYKSLAYLHSEELSLGTLWHQYKLQKCILGNAFYQSSFAAVSPISMHIAILTCSFLKEVDVLVNDNNVIYALSDFENLSSILVQWESLDGGDFQLGVQLLLEKIGPNLKNLYILNFFNVDFALIADKCPNLENLKVEYHSEYSGHSCTSPCFQNLNYFAIENIHDESGCRENTLLLLLSDCTNLTKLNIQNAEHLTDRVLGQILAKNSLSKVNEATILECSLTAEGIRKLSTSLKMLEYFNFSSSAINFEDAASIVHSINPHVIMSSNFM